MQIITIIDEKYPKRLLEINDPPKILYVEGDMNLLNNDSIAIVGSRKSTEYGRKYAKKFAEELSKNNVTIISGLAIGIDSIAHEYSKSNLGKTIAVLGCGLDYVYPQENILLYKQILKNGGCIISEYPLGTKADTKKFPKRNRIISGLSIGVLVVEASLKSGSTITGRLRLNAR